MTTKKAEAASTTFHTPQVKALLPQLLAVMEEKEGAERRLTPLLATVNDLRKVAAVEYATKAFNIEIGETFIRWTESIHTGKRIGKVVEISVSGGLGMFDLVIDRHDDAPKVVSLAYATEAAAVDVDDIYAKVEVYNANGKPRVERSNYYNRHKGPQPVHESVRLLRRKAEPLTSVEVEAFLNQTPKRAVSVDAAAAALAKLSPAELERVIERARNGA